MSLTDPPFDRINAFLFGAWLGAVGLALYLAFEILFGQPADLWRFMASAW